MNARPRARLAVTAALSLALLSGAATPANALPASDSSTQLTASAAQKYYWKWSDGYKKTSRTFRESTFGSQEALPHLIATVVPAYPRRTAYLRFYDDGKWKIEAKKKTNSRGIAVLDLDPWCNATETNWCDGTWKYRLSVGDSWQNFKIKFVGN